MNDFGRMLKTLDDDARDALSRQLEWRISAVQTGRLLDVLTARIRAEWDSYANPVFLKVSLQALAGADLIKESPVAGGSPWMPLDRAPEWWDAVRHYEDSQLALLTLDACFATLHLTDPDDDEPPAVVSVAIQLGRDLGVRGTGRTNPFQCGYRLLELALEAGVLHPDVLITKRAKGSIKYETTRIRLSDAALAQRSEIEQELAKAIRLPERPQTEKPDPVVAIRRNKYDPNDAPQPTGFAVETALDAIQGTRWKVNRFMLDAIRRYVLTDNVAITAAERGALEHAAVWAECPTGFFYKQRFDYRGRVYARGRALQFTAASDLVRSLLEFHTPARCDVDALIWLANQVADCHPDAPRVETKGDYGHRVVWVESHIDELRAVVRDPIGKRAFWLTGKHKKQFRLLASIHAYVTALDTGYSTLPVVLDASCSGLQHIALLLRSADLARHVNLWPGPRSDFYGLIASETSYSRDQVKQPVMTTFYGAGVESIAEAIAWDERESDRPTEDEYRRAQTVQKAAKRAAPEAWGLFDWLTERAGTDHAIEWDLPDGFRVRQDSRKMDKERNVTVKRAGRAPRRFKENRPLPERSMRRQKQSIGPNFVHSFDACFLRCVVRAGVGGDQPITDWALVHDGFGIPACHVGGLIRASKVALDELYRPDRLGELHSGLGGQLPERGEWDDQFLMSWFTLS